MISKGKGFWVALIVPGSFACVFLGAIWLSGCKEPCGDTLSIPLLIGGSFLLAGVICYALGKRVNRPGGLVIDRMTGREMIYQPNHHLCFVRVEHWGLAFILLGLLFAATLLPGIFR